MPAHSSIAISGFPENVETNAARDAARYQIQMEHTNPNSPAAQQRNPCHT